MGVITDAQKCYQDFVVEGSLYLSYTPRTAPALNRLTSKLSLESATSLYTQISTEGFFEWIKHKVQVLDHKFTVMMNKLYSKFKALDEKTKADIEKAAHEGPDTEVELPISPAKAKLILAAFAATLAGIAFGYKHLLSGGTDENNERAKQKEKVTKAWEAASRKEEKKSTWKNSMVIKFLKSIKDFLSKIWEGIKNFFSGNKKATEQDAHQAQAVEKTEHDRHEENHDAPKGSEGEDQTKLHLFNRIKTKGGWFMSIFGMGTVAFAKAHGVIDVASKGVKAYTTAKGTLDTVKSLTGKSGGDADTRHKYVVAGVVSPKVIFKVGTEPKGCRTVLPSMGKHLIVPFNEWHDEITNELKLERIRPSTMDSKDTILIAYPFSVEGNHPVKSIKDIGAGLKQDVIEIHTGTIYRVPGRLPSGFGS